MVNFFEENKTKSLEKLRKKENYLKKIQNSTRNS